MKIMISFLSALIIFLGIIPFLGEKFFIPNKGTAYLIVLIIGGIIAVILAFVNTLMTGIEKFFLILQGVLILLIAARGLIPSFLAFLPISFIPFAVIVVGLIGLIYGLIGMG
jgi:hypothetical protein